MIQSFLDFMSKNPLKEGLTWDEVAHKFNLGTGERARGLYRRRKKVNSICDTVECNQYISELEEEVVRLIDQQTDHITGNNTSTYTSTKPLSPKELEVLAGVDNINTFVDRSWLKSHKSGMWTYSILMVSKIKDFYNTNELTIKLTEIFGDKPIRKTKPKTRQEDALFIYISDDHAGALITSSLYNKEYSGKTYAQRLLALVDEAKSLERTFSSVYVIRLGDELDGYNAKTTRYDHSLDSASNKEQFDVYTTANKLFYDELFSSGMANDYQIVTLNNSNHTGLGYSYIVNKAMEFWAENKFDNVQFTYQSRFIDVIEFGNHIIGLTHGKDEKYMKSPMPLNLDQKTDLYLFEFYQQYSPKGRFVSTIKGDIHKYNVNQGKSGRYVNVPSVSSGSVWIEHNYGDSKPGALLEVYEANSENIISIPVWF